MTVWGVIKSTVTTPAYSHSFRTSFRTQSSTGEVETLVTVCDIATGLAQSAVSYSKRKCTLKCVIHHGSRTTYFTRLVRCCSAESSILRNVILGDEPQDDGYDPNTKAQDSEWKLPRKTLYQWRSSIRVILLFDLHGIVLAEFESRNFSELWKLQSILELLGNCKVHRKRPGKGADDCIVLHGVVTHPPCMTASVTQSMLVCLKPPYSLDLPLCDFDFSLSPDGYERGAHWNCANSGLWGSNHSTIKGTKCTPRTASDSAKRDGISVLEVKERILRGMMTLFLAKFLKIKYSLYVLITPQIVIFP